MKLTLQLYVSTWLFLSITPSVAQNQEKVDSMLTIIKQVKEDTAKATQYIKLADLIFYSDMETAFGYLEEAEKLYAATPDTRGEAKLLIFKSNYYYRRGHIDTALYYLEEAVKKYIEIRDTLEIAKTQYNMSILEQYGGNGERASELIETIIPVFQNYKDTVMLGKSHMMRGRIALTDGYNQIALQEFTKALKWHRQMKDDRGAAGDLFQIGILYSLTDEYEKALDTYQESYDLYDKIDHEQNKAQLLAYMAHANTQLERFEPAEDNLNKALTASKKLNYNANIARVYSHLGNLNYSKKNYPEAIASYEKSLEVWKTINSEMNEAYTFLYMGQTYLADKEYIQSIRYLDQCIAIADAHNDPGLQQLAYLEKSTALEHLNNFEQSLQYLKLNRSINDSLYSIEKKKATHELQFIYETEKKEHEIELQHKEISLLKEKEKVHGLQRSLLGVGLSLSLLVIGFGFYGFRQKIKRSQTEKEKIDIELAFKRKELTTHTLHLVKKNDLLGDLQEKLNEIRKSSTENKSELNRLVQLIKNDHVAEKDWENFKMYFEQVHQDFDLKLRDKIDDLTNNEIRLAALMKMNLTTKEIANILNISPESVRKARYRLRKKLKLPEDDNLNDFLIAL